MAGDRPEDLISYVGCSASRCGYCGSSRSFASFGIWAHALSPSSYKKLIDRGWRRSGHYLYKPNLARTCCQLYTIRLDAEAFVADKKQRQALNKLNRFIIGHDASRSAADVTGGKRPGKGAVFDLAQAVHAAESKSAAGDALDGDPGGHTFTVTLEPASFTEEGYELYRKYQIAVHGDKPSSLTERGYKRFLCDSPLSRIPIPFAKSHDGSSSQTEATGSARRTETIDLERLPREYGSYHQHYRLDGQLVAVGVLDILPGCVSSVYLFYDPARSALSLGRVSACREALLARELQSATSTTCNASDSDTTDSADCRNAALGSAAVTAGETTVRGSGAVTKWFYYMGYYIPTCPKMAYKGDYHPSYLADPVTLAWRPLHAFKAVWAQRKAALKVGDQDTGSDADTSTQTKAVDEAGSQRGSGRPNPGIDWFVSFDKNTGLPIDRTARTVGSSTVPANPVSRVNNGDADDVNDGDDDDEKTHDDHGHGITSGDDDDDNDDNDDGISDDDPEADAADDDSDDRFDSIPSLFPRPSTTQPTLSSTVPQAGLDAPPPPAEEAVVGATLLYSSSLGGALPMSTYRQILTACGDGAAADRAFGQVGRLYRAMGADVASAALVVLQD